MTKVTHSGMGFLRFGAKMVTAAISAVNSAMTAAVLHAKDDHRPGAHARGRFETHTGTLERGIRILSPAHVAGINLVRGVWGVAGVPYAVRVEFGGKKARAYPYLRPAQGYAARRLPVLFAAAVKAQGL